MIEITKQTQEGDTQEGKTNRCNRTNREKFNKGINVYHGKQKGVCNHKTKDSIHS